MSITDRDWVTTAIARLANEAAGVPPTPVYTIALQDSGVVLHLKDESQLPTGSLKHRLARALIHHGLCSGRIHAGTRLVEASSGSTAVSEAYFAQMLGLEFVAVMPSGTSPQKIALIEAYGGRCHLIDDPTRIYQEATRIAAKSGGYYLDQFTNAERAVHWHSDDSLAGELLGQLRDERHPIPTWFVLGAGTGGTATTVGRYLRNRRLASRICVVDPEGSAFYPGWMGGDREVTTRRSSRIEGIGRPQVEFSFEFGVVDHMIAVPDAASVAAARHLAAAVGIHGGGSTGTSLWGALALAHEMDRAGQPGSVVVLVADRGDRYAHSYYDDGWVEAERLDLDPYAAALERFLPSRH